ncbi:MAG: hypothetical protein AAF572_06935 [Cyanobacteria bacterium P01_B01_bin.77]
MHKILLNFRKITWPPFLLFLLCLAVYLSDGNTLSAYDTYPNTIYAFNWLENHTIYLDELRNSYVLDIINYPFVESIQGHLTSVYPIGAAIVTFPIYFCFYIYLKLSSIPVDISLQSFEEYRVLFEKIAATFTASASVVLFYLLSRLKFDFFIAAITTFIFAFCTNSWATSSQGLWQHGPLNLLLLLTVYCLLKANRQVEVRAQKIWLFFAGLGCGMLPVTRPTSMCFWIAIVLTCLIVYRASIFHFLLGLSSSLIGVIWNLYFFGNIKGGYSVGLFAKSSPYSLAPDLVSTATIGSLFSPSRGLFFFSPILLFSLFGLYLFLTQKKRGIDEKFMFSIFISSFILISSYFFYTVWWAGYSYGPRFMTDALPGLVYLINYFLLGVFGGWFFRRPTLKVLTLILFFLSLSLSLFSQMSGVYGSRAGSLWHVIPLDVIHHNERFFELHDNQINRNFNAIISSVFITPKILENDSYISNLSGVISDIYICSDDDCFTPGNYRPSEDLKLFFRVHVENTGASKWYGYESALLKGEARVRARFFSSDSTNNNIVHEARLFISGPVSSGATSIGIGEIVIPKKPDEYEIVFDLVSEGVAEFSYNAPKSIKLKTLNY